MVSTGACSPCTPPSASHLSLFPKAAPAGPCCPAPLCAEGGSGSPCHVCGPTQHSALEGLQNPFVGAEEPMLTSPHPGSPCPGRATPQTTHSYSSPQMPTHGGPGESQTIPAMPWSTVLLCPLGWRGFTWEVIPKEVGERKRGSRQQERRQEQHKVGLRGHHCGQWGHFQGLFPERQGAFYQVASTTVWGGPQEASRTWGRCTDSQLLLLIP